MSDMIEHMPGLPAAAQTTGDDGGVAIAARNLNTGAMRIAKSRDPITVQKELDILATAYGDDWRYRLPFKDHATGRTTTVTGPTIGCTTSVAMAWGNCTFGVSEVVDEGDSWIIYGSFTDIQSGAQYVRPLRQRKAQSSGRMQSDRALDNAFLIGVSKAVRNAIYGALRPQVDRALAAADAGFGKKLENRRGHYQQWLESFCERQEIPIARIEQSVAARLPRWSTMQFAGVLQIARSVEDGLLPAAEAWQEPEADDAADVTGKSTETKKPARRKPKAKAEVMEEKPPADDEAGDSGGDEADDSGGGDDEQPSERAKPPSRRGRRKPPAKPGAEPEAEPEVGPDDEGDDEGDDQTEWFGEEG